MVVHVSPLSESAHGECWTIRHSGTDLDGDDVVRWTPHEPHRQYHVVTSASTDGRIARIRDDSLQLIHLSTRLVTPGDNARVADQVWFAAVCSAYVVTIDKIGRIVLFSAVGHVRSSAVLCPQQPVLDASSLLRMRRLRDDLLHARDTVVTAYVVGHGLRFWDPQAPATSYDAAVPLNSLPQLVYDLHISEDGHSIAVAYREEDAFGLVVFSGVAPFALLRCIGVCNDLDTVQLPATQQHRMSRFWYGAAVWVLPALGLAVPLRQRDSWVFLKDRRIADMHRSGWELFNTVDSVHPHVQLTHARTPRQYRLVHLHLQVHYILVLLQLHARLPPELSHLLWQLFVTQPWDDMNYDHGPGIQVCAYVNV
jgi:hypothetical protein